VIGKISLDCKSWGIEAGEPPEKQVNKNIKIYKPDH